MSSRRFKFQLNRSTYYRSLLHIIIFVVLGVGLYFIYDSEFILAWYTSFVVGLVLLMTLSIPRRIVLSDRRITINCLLDVTEIAIDEIAIIRKVSPRTIGWSIPLFGGDGFFGYYGHFFDVRHFRRFVIYASEWDNIIEIVDIYEDYYYISCRQQDEFISYVKSRM